MWWKLLILMAILITTMAYARQQVPDTQILITTNLYTVITGVTNLNDALQWIDTFLAKGVSTNQSISNYTGNIWFKNGIATNIGSP